jgi:hypothetical protein
MLSAPRWPTFRILPHMEHKKSRGKGNVSCGRAPHDTSHAQRCQNCLKTPVSWGAKSNESTAVAACHFDFIAANGVPESLSVKNTQRAS